MLSRRLLVPFLAIVALLALLAALGFWRPPALAPDAAEPAHRQIGLAATPRGGDFTLRGAGGPVALRDLRGRVVLLYFGYTWCPDICPTNLALIALALRGLTAAEREQVQVLFVSVDPGRDTPRRLREYAAYFHPDIIGLTGSAAEIAAVAARYGVAYRRVEQPGSALGYAVDHSASTYVIAPDGRLAATLGHATPAEQVIAAVREQLAGGSEPSAPGPR